MCFKWVLLLSVLAFYFRPGEAYCMGRDPDDEKACVLGHILQLLVKYMEDSEEAKDLLTNAIGLEDPHNQTVPHKNRPIRRHTMNGPPPREQLIPASLEKENKLERAPSSTTAATIEMLKPIPETDGRDEEDSGYDSGEISWEEDADATELLCIAHLKSDSEWKNFLKTVLTE